jgi:hypothetical protein
MATVLAQQPEIEWAQPNYLSRVDTVPFTACSVSQVFGENQLGGTSAALRRSFGRCQQQH